MEEKERYELFGEFGIIHDTSQNAECMLLNKFQTCEILNRQDKRIKELEEKIEIQKNKEELIAENEAMKDTLAVVLAQKRNVGQANKKLRKENEELKQQLHDLPKKIVEEIRDDMSKRIMEKQIKWGDNIQIGFICNAINECLDAIL